MSKETTHGEFLKHLQWQPRSLGFSMPTQPGSSQHIFTEAVSAVETSRSPSSIRVLTRSPPWPCQPHRCHQMMAPVSTTMATSLTKGSLEPVSTHSKPAACGATRMELLQSAFQKEEQALLPDCLILPCDRTTFLVFKMAQTLKLPFVLF